MHLKLFRSVRRLRYYLAVESFQISDQEVFELKRLFLRELSEGLQAARKQHEAFLRDPGDEQAIRQIYDFFHRIAGTAGQVDLTVLGRLALICERVLGLVQKKVALPPAVLANIISDGLSAVSDVLGEYQVSDDEERVCAAVPPTPALSVPETVGDGRQLSKILVVDDDPFSAGLIDSTLRASGFMSSFTCDPKTAIRAIEEELPDLIVLDVVMPEVDGFQICKRVRKHPALQFTPIIFVTRRGELDQRLKGLEVGGNDYISKPFEPQELVARVRSHLQRLSVLREMAIRDGLTRCYNHRYFKNRLEQEVARSRRYEQQLSMALVDIDQFKELNDRYGHSVGDAALVHLAGIIMASVRTTDVVARYGGDEFALLMVQAGQNEAQIIAGRMCSRIAKHQFELPPEALSGSQPPSVTVSVGLAPLISREESAADLLRRADKALYAAKRAGRNTVRTQIEPVS